MLEVVQHVFFCDSALLEKFIHLSQRGYAQLRAPRLSFDIKGSQLLEKESS